MIKLLELPKIQYEEIQYEEIEQVDAMGNKTHTVGSYTWLPCKIETDFIVDNKNNLIIDGIKFSEWHISKNQNEYFLNFKHAIMIDYDIKEVENESI